MTDKEIEGVLNFKNNIKDGEHFWALLDQKLIVLIAMLDRSGTLLFFPCGDYEGKVERNSFIFVSKISTPIGFENTDWYYNMFAKSSRKRN